MIKLSIITEGYEHTGYGHVVRCSAIANAFIKCGAEVFFILNGDNSALNLLKEYTVYSINWLEDNEKLPNLLLGSDIVVVDSYLASKDIYTLIAENVKTPIYIDDFVRLNYPPGIIVNGTVGAEYLPYEKIPSQEFLLGANYVILRHSFYRLSPRSSFLNDIQTVLITFGGSDPKELTKIILPILTATYPQIKKKVIVGAAFSNVSDLEMLGDQQTEFCYNVNAEQMRELMLSSDIAISAAGQTLNELASAGLPSVVFKVAENQTNNIYGWLSVGFITSYIDATNNWSVDELLTSLNSLNKSEVRKTLSVLGQSVVDGDGAMRVARSAITSYYKTKIQIRDATEADLDFLFNLANDEEVRQQSFSTREISFDEHTAWFKSVLEDPNRLLYLFFVDKIFLGQIRFDLMVDNAVVSISVQSGFRGLGLGPELLRLALSKLKLKRGIKIKDVYAYVKDRNLASKKTFVKAGFSICDCEKGEISKYHYRL